MSRSQYKNS